MLEWRILTHPPKKGNQSPQTIQSKNNTIVEKSLKFVVGVGVGATHCCFAQPTTAKPLGFFLRKKGCLAYQMMVLVVLHSFEGE